MTIAKKYFLHKFHDPLNVGGQPVQPSEHFLFSFLVGGLDLKSKISQYPERPKVDPSRSPGYCANYARSHWTTRI